MASMLFCYCKITFITQKISMIIPVFSNKNTVVPLYIALGGRQGKIAIHLIRDGIQACKIRREDSKIDKDNLQVITVNLYVYWNFRNKINDGNLYSLFSSLHKYYIKVPVKVNLFWRWGGRN